MPQALTHLRRPRGDDAENGDSRLPRRGQLGSRSLAFEVLAVTQFTPHCLRITLVAEDVAIRELTSGQELSLAHGGIHGMPSRWIVRECNPRTNRLTAGAILSLGSLDARRWASTLLPGEMVLGQPATAPSSNGAGPVAPQRRMPSGHAPGRDGHHHPLNCLNHETKRED
jgi:hypothetical protein